VTQGEDQTESRDSIEHACLESGWLARLALVNDNEQKLYNYLNAHGLGVYYTITTSHGMNHHYSTAGLRPSAIRKACSGLDGDSNSIPLEVISPRSVVAEWR
jgi:hypothetical protein